MPARARKPRKPRPPGYTTTHGWGSVHQKLAAAALAVWQPGDPCTRCGLPMWQRWTITPTGRKVSAIHLGHTDDRTGYRGLEHARCNVSDGATRGNLARGTAHGKRMTGMDMTAVRMVRPSRVW